MNTSMADIGFWTRNSNIHWCEDVIAGYDHSFYVAEWWNTVSNVSFLLAAGVGIHRALSRKLPGCFFWTEVSLICVGLGSMLFHATQSLTGEILDELPMSILACGYLECMRGRHWLTSTTSSKWLYPTVYAVVIIAWVVYIPTRIYDMFLVLFTLQIIVPALTSYWAHRGDGMQCSRLWWWMFLVFILLGQVAWRYERFLYVQGSCTKQPFNLTRWLHPFWHIMASAAHAAWLHYASKLPLVQSNKQA